MYIIICILLIFRMLCDVHNTELTRHRRRLNIALCITNMFRILTVFECFQSDKENVPTIMTKRAVYYEQRMNGFRVYRPRAFLPQNDGDRFKVKTKAHSMSLLTESLCVYYREGRGCHYLKIKLLFHSIKQGLLHMLHEYHHHVYQVIYTCI